MPLVPHYSVQMTYQRKEGLLQWLLWMVTFHRGRKQHMVGEEGTGESWLILLSCSG